MATLKELLKLRGTVPGITITESADGFIKVGFRPTQEGLGDSQTNRTYTQQRQFPRTADGYKRAISFFKNLKSTYKDEIAKFSGSRVDKAKELLGDYTNLKKTYSQELVDEIKKLTKQKKYKNFAQVENALYKKFNKPKYTAVKNVDPKTVFFNPKTKVFNIPRGFEIYGGEFGKKRPDEIKNAIRQIIGTQFFANSPNFKKEREYLTNFYTNSDYQPTTAERNLMRKFTQDFSVTRSIGAQGLESSIIGRFFRDLNFDFSRKLKDVGKIFNLQEHLKEQIKNPRTSAADKRFFQTELKSLTNDNNTILKRLKEKFPGLFTGQAGQGGSLQLEHRIARALGEKGPLKLPKNYIARATRVPGQFNRAKYEAFDKPLMNLTTEYKAASKSKKPEIKSQIEKLTKDFNKRTGGYLDSLKFNFGNTVKITDSTPLVSQVKGPDLLFDIDKSLKQSNKFFTSYGDERLKGMPKASAASDFVTSGKEYNEFKKLVNAVKRAPQACRSILDYSTGGISKTCAAAIEADPVRAATKLEELKPTSAALGKVRNAARSFLNFAGKGKTFAVTAGVGAGAGALVKAFRNDDPETYLTNDKQANAMILDTADQLEREERQAAVGDAPELLDESAIGAELGLAAAAVPGSKKLFDARKKKGFGAVRAGLGPVGKALSGFATPLGIAATTPLNVASQVYAGDSVEDIATDPLNYLGPAFAGTLTKEATRGMNPTGMLSKALRLGMNPATIRAGSKFLGLPGLALSLGYEGYDQYKKYTEGRGFVYNLLNKDE
jgi:hypothetical protein